MWLIIKVLTSRASKFLDTVQDPVGLENTTHTTKDKHELQHRITRENYMKRVKNYYKKVCLLPLINSKEYVKYCKIIILDY